MSISKRQKCAWYRVSNFGSKDRTFASLGAVRAYLQGIDRGYRIGTFSDPVLSTVWIDEDAPIQAGTWQGADWLDARGIWQGRVIFYVCEAE